MKIWRRLQAVGAVTVQNAIYVLPNTDACREQFEWVVREIQRHGGEASVCEARLIEGFGDEEIRAAFVEAREHDYRAIGEEAEKLLHALSNRGPRARRLPSLATSVERLRRRKGEVEAIDFFSAPGGNALERLIARLERRSGAATERRAEDRAPRWQRSDVQGRTWVTRKGIYVDRIASAWLIREFIDPEARFKFVSARGYEPQAGELRFDMYEAEFTHDGDLCTFEVLLRDFALGEAALQAIAEIVHAIDLKEDDTARPETVGVAHVLEGIARRYEDDDARLREGSAVFAALHAYFRRSKGGAP